MTATLTGNQRLRIFFQLMDNCLEKRLDMARDKGAAAQMQEALVGLQELAVGIWMEKELQSDNGVINARVYKRAPDKKAIALLASIYNYDPTTISNSLLSATRAEAVIVQQKLMLQQRDQSKAIEAKTIRETQAMDASYATEDQFVQMGIQLSAAIENIIDATPVADFPRTEQGKQRLKERVARRLKEVLDELLSTKPDEEDEEE